MCPLRLRALAIVQAHPDGVYASAIASALGCSAATASSALARLYWAEQIDRGPFERRRGYCYRPRITPDDHARSPTA